MNFDKLEFSEFYFSALLEIMNSENGSRRKALLVRKLLRDMVGEILKSEKLFFSSFYSKLIYFLSSSRFSEETAALARKTQYLLKRTRSDKNFIPAQKILKSIYYSTALLISEYSATPVPAEILAGIGEKNDFADFGFKTKKTGIIDKTHAVVIKKGKAKTDKTGNITEAEILCDSYDLGEFSLRLTHFWTDFYDTVFEGASVNLFKIKPVENRRDFYRTGLESVLVLEPDILIDVTDIAECFQTSGYNFLLYFLKKYIYSPAGVKMITGNIVNHIFDELINDKDAVFDEIYNKAVSMKPLQLFYAYRTDNSGVRQMKTNAEAHYHRLKKLINGAQERSSVEPSFISPDYGLQGRLDLLIEYDSDPLRKDIVELKSGKAPAKEYSIDLPGGKKIPIGVWNNHLAQTACYNLLLDSAYNNRTGTSRILYSGAGEFPLRDAPNIVRKKQEAVQCRNRIAAAERHLILGNYSLFQSLTLQNIGSIPKFSEAHAVRFANAYRNASETERAYFHEFSSFITAELYAAKAGTAGSRGNGYSALWKETLVEKTDSMTAISGLEVSPQESDFNQFHICFRKNEDIFAGSVKKGDAVIIYAEDSENEVWRGALIKGYVKDFNSEKIVISLRNKLSSFEMFLNGSKWAAEHDLIESGSKSLFQSLFDFLQAGKEKRELLLGLAKPRFDDLKMYKLQELSEFQNILVSRALSAKDYFLVQGPPGTGKTSYLLKNLVRIIFEETNDHILLLAYTNRAVDEICSALRKIDDDFPFLRIGSKNCSEDTRNLLPHLTETLPLREVYKLTGRTRVIVSTVSSALMNREIFGLFRFDTAIIDEASQILEPQIIGILTKVKRFIMIGDEKQLPAVVLQEQNMVSTENPYLRSVNLVNPAVSLFERLLRNASEAGWNEAYGMLRHQARMHEDIQFFPGNYFYEGQLETFFKHGWQSAPGSLFSVAEKDSLESALSASRIIFFDTPLEKRTKVNTFEAAAAVKLILKIRDVYYRRELDFNSNTIGVISPFRAQCSEIYRLLPPEMREIILIDTVERFQGSERDIIIISYAVNHEHLLKRISSETVFAGAKVDRKLNVSITRARQKLILFGSSALLEKLPVYGEFLQFIKQRSGMISLKETMEIFR